MIKMPLKKAVTSKGMIGGAIVVALGIYIVIQGDFTSGMLAVGGGLSLMGIRDKDDG